MVGVAEKRFVVGQSGANCRLTVPSTCAHLSYIIRLETHRWLMCACLSATMNVRFLNKKIAY